MFDRLLTGSMLCGIVTRLHRAFTREWYCIDRPSVEIFYIVSIQVSIARANSVDFPLPATTTNNNGCVVIVLITIA